MAVERREYPRADLSELAEVRLFDGTALHARTINVSRAGVQLEADEVLRDRIFPNGQPLTPASRPRLAVRLRLPDILDVEADGEAVLFRRIGANCYRIGVRFLAFRGDAFTSLERFVYDRGH